MKKIVIFSFFYFMFITTHCQIIYNDSIKIIEKSIITTPRINADIKSYIVFNNGYFDSIAQPCDNFKAQKYFISRLNAIKIVFVFWKNVDLATEDDIKLITEDDIKLITEELMNVFFDGVDNFVFLTKIQTGSEFSFIGTYQPTENDIRLWEEWYSLNKEFICWDEKSGFIYCNSCILIPKNGVH